MASKEIWWPGKKGKRLIVDETFQWITWDHDNECWIWTACPVRNFEDGIWGQYFWVRKEGRSLRVGKIKPPEPGPWDEQIYEIQEDLVLQGGVFSN